LRGLIEEFSSLNPSRDMNVGPYVNVLLFVALQCQKPCDGLLSHPRNSSAYRRDLKRNVLEPLSGSNTIIFLLPSSRGILGREAV